MVARTKKDYDMDKLDNLYLHLFELFPINLYKQVLFFKIYCKTMFSDIGIFLSLPQTTLDSQEKIRNPTSIKLYTTQLYSCATISIVAN